MPTFLHRVLLLLLVVPLSARATSPEIKAKPVSPPVALPAFLDVTTFSVRTEGETRKLIVTTTPTLVRIDAPEDRYSVIYDPKTEHYIGLEHSNYTWWEFSWPEVRGAVEASKRYESRLEQLNQEGVNNPDPSAPPAATNGPSETVPDDAGYVWRPSTTTRKIDGLTCTLWTGDTVSGDSVEAWCYNGMLPKVQAAVDRLREMNDPVALVPVRTLVPSLIFPVFDALIRGGVTPVLLNWGADSERSSFSVVASATRPAKIDVFTVPNLYMKTTLVTMDGLIDQKK
jgi:hypothetical protein